MRRRPVARTAAKTAVVAGTATAVSGKVAQKQAAAAQPPAAPAAAPAPASPDPAIIEHLRALGELHATGVLTDEEFAAQKAKWLA